MILPEHVARAILLYVPLVTCAVLFIVRRPSPRHSAAALLALLWAVPAIVAVELIAERAGWWTCSVPRGVFPAPGDVVLGWAVMWGPLPVLALWRRPLLAVAGALWVDFCWMPTAHNLITLGTWWPLGELVALITVLMPGLLLARWTIERRFLRARTVMQMSIFTAWTLWLIPTVALRMRPPTGRPLWFVLPALAPFGVVAVSAVQEFTRRGGGTPLPYDPPVRLVTSGPYAYVANPMQLSMTLLLLGAGVVLRSSYLALGAVVATAYGSGLAEWHEGVTMSGRFGEHWRTYRANVRGWLPRLRPYIPETSTVYIGATCDVCSGVGGWITRRTPSGLRVAAAETLESPPRRMMYVPADGGPPDYGVAAFGRALEHVNTAWALVGFGLRLPPLRAFVQVVVDASGGGPRTIPSLHESSRGVTCSTSGSH
jgi:protein-S-isoprenylcysteine O-methyltransferase Ste14